MLILMSQSGIDAYNHGERESDSDRDQSSSSESLPERNRFLPKNPKPTANHETSPKQTSHSSSDQEIEQEDLISETQNQILTESGAFERGPLGVLAQLYSPISKQPLNDTSYQSTGSTRPAPKWGCSIDEYIAVRVPEKFKLSKSAVSAVGLACVLSHDICLSSAEEEHLGQFLLSLAEVKTGNTILQPVTSLVAVSTLHKCTQGTPDIRLWALRVGMSKYTTQQKLLAKKAVLQGKEFAQSAETRMKKTIELQGQLCKERELFRKHAKETVEICKERLRGQCLALTQEHLGGLMDKIKRLEKKADSMQKEFHSQLVARTQPLRDALKLSKDKLAELEDQVRRKDEENSTLKSEVKLLKKSIKSLKLEKTDIKPVPQIPIILPVEVDTKKSMTSKSTQCVQEDTEKWAFQILWNSAVTRKEVEPVSHLLMFRLSSANNRTQGIEWCANYQVSASLHNQACKALQAMPDLAQELARSGKLYSILEQVSRGGEKGESQDHHTAQHQLVLRLLLDVCFAPQSCHATAVLSAPQTARVTLLLVESALCSGDIGLLEQSVILLEKISGMTAFHEGLEEKVRCVGRRVQDFIAGEEAAARGPGARGDRKNLHFVKANLKVVWLNLGDEDGGLGSIHPRNEPPN